MSTNTKSGQNTSAMRFAGVAGLLVLGKRKPRPQRTMQRTAKWDVVFNDQDSENTLSSPGDY
jgi:hypothetical protein